MPWKEVNPMELREQFIADWRRGKRTVMELCALYGISRTTAYKWIERYELAGGGEEAAGGWAQDRSRAAQVVHNKTAPEIEEALMRLRLRFPRWGARKLVHEVGLANPQWAMPGESTVCDMLKRRGLIESKPRRRAVGHPGRPSLHVAGPNDCWSADYKGQFRLGNGQYCYPLTVTDNYSRYLLACHGLQGTLLEPTKEVFTRVFKEYGLPSRIRTDNGVPFAGVTLGRLSQLSVWWIQAGHPAGTDCAGPAAAERATREDAQDTEGRGDQAAGVQPARAAAQAQRVQARVQRTQAAREPGHEQARTAVRTVAKGDAGQAAADGVPGPL